MPEIFGKYAAVFLTSMFKFIFGPLAGASSGISYFPSVLLTIGGMMTTVVFLSYIGSDFRNRLILTFYKNPRKFTPRNRKIVVIWRKYGAWGVSFLTPVFFSPVIGTLIVIAFGEHKFRIIRLMLFAAVFWSFLLNAVVFFIGKEVITQLLP